MRRTSLALLAGLLILLPVAGRAADEGPAGNWKLSIYQKGKMRLVGLVQLESADGKWAIKLIEGGMKVSDPTVADGMLRFTVTAQDGVLKFEGQLPKGEAKLITGNISNASVALPAEMERTSMKELTEFNLRKDALAKATGYEAADLGLGLLKTAGDNKAKPEEVRSWAEKAYRAAEAYGPRIQAELTLDIAAALADQDGYADIAVNYARRAERGLEPKSKLSRVKRTLDVLAVALKKAGKDDEVKAVTERIAKLDPEIKPAPYAGRKSKSNRAVLVELFTGAQCPPCYAADKAFDALGKTYKPGEVVLLEYHVHNPGPDPLTCPGGERRLRFYVPPMEGGTPMLFANGKLVTDSGGDEFEAVERYDEYVEAINPLLEPAARAAIKLSATRKENKVEITAEASEIDVPASTPVRLRLALVEEKVAYKGTNGIPEYHHVVRDLPGGALGVPVKDGAAKQTVTVDLDDLKKTLKKYLDEWAAENEAKFPGKVPEIELKNLHVVAFVQNDKTKEVLQAAQVEVKAEK
jgi:hypothetical protein